ncbi:hypothetical protein [Leisingera sp. ANG59]|uniref:hypothetical protein n=1 Tax=Leisingera sp. ANG59 TaxID=2675221 RepID=UPI001572046E|nr:hypothetical protein [Leisingera sp. ANG59]NSY37541.1 hypothetical protein [Leisingera sp. ANG59]
MNFPNVTGRAGRFLILIGITATLSGCLAAALPVAGMVAGPALVNNTLDKTVDHNLKVQRMNCSQLRAEHARLESNKLARINPYGNWAVRRASVKEAAARRGCRL